MPLRGLPPRQRRPGAGLVQRAQGRAALDPRHLARNPSSPGVERLFCGNCGTQLTWHSAAAPDEIDVTTGSLDDPDTLPPADHTYYSQRVRWLHLADDLPRYPRLRTDGMEG